jgi:uncharacterized ferredoxin-like protein
MQNGVDIVAELMRLAAVTAPKSMGQDYLEIRLCTREEMDRVAVEMLAIGKEKKTPNWERDAKGIEKSDGLVLIGIKPHKGVGLNCGACGFSTCAEFDRAGAETDFRGPNCMLRLMDLGIALGSAAKTAQLHNVDNRIMYRAGVAARKLGLMKSNAVMGIPMSVSSKNIYFDR